MITYVPRAASMPPIRALPYPFAGTSTTRAPCARAMSCDPSVEPLSATITSPATPLRARYPFALSMHVARVSASSRHGITIDSSIVSVAAGMQGSCRYGRRPLHRTE
jgi:hypothetical protein